MDIRLTKINEGGGRISNVGIYMEQLKLLYITGRVKIGTLSLENVWQYLLKLKNFCTITQQFHF